MEESTAKESGRIRREIPMKEIGKMTRYVIPVFVNKMCLAYLFSSTLFQYRDMEQEPPRMPQEMYIKANGSEIVWKAKAFIPLYTETPMKAHGKTIR